MSVMDMANITCGILVGRNFFSLCSEVSFIIGVLAGGMGRIYVLNSPVPPGAFGSAAGGWGEAVEDSRERPGNFPSRQGVGCFCGVQRALLFTGLCSTAGDSVGARFPKEVGVGKRLGSPDLICSAEGLGPWLGLHSPACIPHIPDARWKRQVCFQL